MNTLAAWHTAPKEPHLEDDGWKFEILTSTSAEDRAWMELCMHASSSLNHGET
jgi:hypothetical protein